MHLLSCLLCPQIKNSVEKILEASLQRLDPDFHYSPLRDSNGSKNSDQVNFYIIMIYLISFQGEIDHSACQNWHSNC